MSSPVTAAYLARLAAGRCPKHYALAVFTFAPGTIEAHEVKVVLTERKAYLAPEMQASPDETGPVPITAGHASAGDSLIPEKIALHCFSSYPDGFVA
jgi:hypothetical protein